MSAIAMNLNQETVNQTVIGMDVSPAAHSTEPVKVNNSVDNEIGTSKDNQTGQNAGEVKITKASLRGGQKVVPDKNYNVLFLAKDEGIEKLVNL